jgi:hypothetical protein
MVRVDARQIGLEDLLGQLVRGAMQGWAAGEDRSGLPQWCWGLAFSRDGG